MKKTWKIKEPPDKQLSKNLQKEIKVPKVISDLLVLRGIKSFPEAKEFFRPQLNQLFDPFLMKDMEKAVNIIFEALENNMKIMIYGDYDVDGITSVAIIYLFFKSLNQ